MNSYLKGKLGILIGIIGIFVCVPIASFLSSIFEIDLNGIAGVFFFGVPFIIWLLVIARIANTIINKADQRHIMNVAREIIAAELDQKAVKNLIIQAIKEANYHVNHASIEPGTTATHILANTALFDIKNTIKSKELSLDELNRIIDTAIANNISILIESTLIP